MLAKSSILGRPLPGLAGRRQYNGAAVARGARWAPGASPVARPLTTRAAALAAPSVKRAQPLRGSRAIGTGRLTGRRETACSALGNVANVLEGATSILGVPPGIETLAVKFGFIALGVLVASVAVRRLGLEKLLTPEGVAAEAEIEEALKRSGLNPFPLEKAMVHSYLSHPFRSWIYATAFFVMLTAGAQYLDACGTTTALFHACVTQLETAWRLMSIACAAWVVGAFEKETFSRFARQNPRDAPWLGTYSAFVRRLTWLIAALLMLETVGFHVKALLAFGGVGGLAIGLASQTVASNVVSGASLLASRVFVENEKIDLPGRNTTGWVTKLSIANTTLLLEDGSPLVVPNGELAKATVRNLSRLSHRRILAIYRIPHTYLPQVRKLTQDMEAYLRSRPEVDDLPKRLPTRVVLVEIGEYALSISAQAYIPAPGMSLVVYERLRQEILLDLGSIILDAGVPFQLPRSMVDMNTAGGMNANGMPALGGSSLM